MNRELEQIHNLSSEYWERFRIAGGQNQNELKIFLNRDKVKMTWLNVNHGEEFWKWLEERYSKEFDKLWQEYTESETYRKKFSRLNGLDK